MHELTAANNGYIRANKPEVPNADPMTRDEFNALKNKLEKVQNG